MPSPGDSARQSIARRVCRNDRTTPSIPPRNGIPIASRATCLSSSFTKMNWTRLQRFLSPRVLCAQCGIKHRTPKKECACVMGTRNQGFRLSRYNTRKQQRRRDREATHEFERQTKLRTGMDWGREWTFMALLVPLISPPSRNGKTASGCA